MCPEDASKLEPRFQRWAQIRSRGKWRFVICYGTLGIGVPFALLWSVFFAWAVGDSFRSVFPFAAPISPIGGTVFAWWAWRSAERDYAKAIAALGDAAG